MPSVKGRSPIGKGILRGIPQSADNLLVETILGNAFGPERRFRSFEILDIAPAMPAVSKELKPCSEPKSTGYAWARFYFGENTGSNYGR